jgi:hypothetical protein
MDFKEALVDYAEAPLPLHVILHLLKGYKRPFDKINELVRQEILTPVKNGLFIPGIKTKITKPEPFLIANHLWGPSYVSLESALAYWGYIPERVFEISSVTVKSAKTYLTKAGRFSYLHASLPYYSLGIISISLTKKQTVMIASPEKALCDKIIMTTGILLRSTKQVRDYLLDELRMDEEMLGKLDINEIESWITNSSKKESLQMLVKTLKNL